MILSLKNIKKSFLVDPAFAYKTKTMTTGQTQSLRYLFPLENKKSNLSITFTYYPEQETIACFYEINSWISKKQVYQEKYSFTDDLSKKLPGIDQKYVSILEKVNEYHVVDEVIKRKTPISEISKKYIEILQGSLPNMIDYAKSVHLAKQTQ